MVVVEDAVDAHMLGGAVGDIALGVELGGPLGEHAASALLLLVAAQLNECMGTRSEVVALWPSWTTVGRKSDLTT